MNRRHGYGVFYAPKGEVLYEGNWHNDMRSGQGKLSHNGRKVMYEGRFWRGHWVSFNWYHLRYYLGFLVARVAYPVVGLVAGLLVVALGCLVMLPAPMSA